MQPFSACIALGVYGMMQLHIHEPNLSKLPLVNDARICRYGLLLNIHRYRRALSK
jgi:hypothetical protein